MQEVKDAAKAQEPIGAKTPQKPIAANADDEKPLKVSTSAHPEETPGDEITTDKGEEGEKSVAGRKTMKGGETKDVHSGKEAPMGVGKNKDKATDEKKSAETEDKVQSKEDHEVEMELNSILKKGPSTCLLPLPACCSGI